MPHDTQVAIVGGGPVGLALAISLGQRGVRCILVEPRTTMHRIPKGQNLTQRTLEHFWCWGIVENLRPVIVAVGPGSPVYTRETTIIRGNGVTTVTRVRRNPLYDPQYVIVSPNPDEQLADFRSSLFYSASIDDGQFKDGYVFAQRVEGPFIKLSVPIEGQLFEIVFQRVKVPGVFTNLN